MCERHHDTYNDASHISSEQSGFNSPPHHLCSWFPLSPKCWYAWLRFLVHIFCCQVCFVQIPTCVWEAAHSSFTWWEMKPQIFNDDRRLRGKRQNVWGLFHRIKPWIAWTLLKCTHGHTVTHIKASYYSYYSNDIFYICHICIFCLIVTWKVVRWRFSGDDHFQPILWKWLS